MFAAAGGIDGCRDECKNCGRRGKGNRVGRSGGGDDGFVDEKLGDEVSLD